MIKKKAHNIYRHLFTFNFLKMGSTPGGSGGGGCGGWSSPRKVGAENRVVRKGHGDAIYVQMMKLARVVI